MQHRLLILIAALLCLGLSACGSDDDNSTTDVGTDTSMTDTDSGDTGGEDMTDTNSEDMTDTTVEPWEAGEDCTAILEVGVEESGIVGAFIDASDDDVICFGPGTFELATELSLTVDNVEVRGAGMDRTTLDFAPQRDGGVGANGIYVRRDGFTITDITVRNTPGDSVRVEGTADRPAQNTTFRRIRVTWDEPFSPDNGAYALYPVFNDNVLVEDCEISYASDAGIYVGQSRNIIVRNNEVFGNVAGIEIENSFDADVYNNNAHHNTCGLLIFDLPDKPIQGGKRTKAHDNIIDTNDTKNFAPPGNIVGVVPKGCGILVMASDENEIHDNTITGNGTLGIGVVSYFIAEIGYKPDCSDGEDNDGDTLVDMDDPDCEGPLDDSEEDGKQEYDVYPEGNYIHDNTMVNNGADPDRFNDAIALIVGLLMINEVEQLIWDGALDPDKTGDVRNCWQGNVDGEGAQVTWRDLSFDPEEDPFFDGTSTDKTPFDCAGITLPAIDLGR